MAQKRELTPSSSDYFAKNSRNQREFNDFMAFCLNRQGSNRTPTQSEAKTSG